MLTSTPTPVLPPTLSETGLRDKLETALDNMAASTPAELFAGRYRLLPERASGGQAVVAFARDEAHHGISQFALKCAPAFRLPSSSASSLTVCPHVRPLSHLALKCASTFPLPLSASSLSFCPQVRLLFPSPLKCALCLSLTPSPAHD